MADNALRRLRESLDLTQEVFGATVGLSRGFVAAVETDREGLGRQTVLNIVDMFRAKCRELEITAEDLLRIPSTSSTEE